MRRHLRRFPAALLLALVPTVLGTATALLYTEAGHRTLGRVASQELTRMFRGRFTVGRVSGSFLSGIELERVAIQDTLGEPFATVDRMAVRYRLSDLLAGRIVFAGAELDHPDVRIVKRQNGRLNHQEIFRLGEGPGGGASPLVEVRDLRIRDGRVELRLPWHPPDTAQTAALVAEALARDRARAGRRVLVTPDGLRRVVVLDSLNARLPRLVISTPDHAPLTFDVDSLRTRVSDPAVAVVDLAAHAWTHGDSLAFTAHRAALAHSRLSGGGILTWPRGPVLYDFTLTADTLDLADLRWVSPDFPALSGRTVITARSRSDQLTAYTLENLDLRGAPGRLSGTVTALVDQRRGLGVEAMTLDLEGLDLDVPRPYLDTLPLHGVLDGRIAGAGFRDGLVVTMDLAFRDDSVPGAPVTLLAGGGHLVLGGPAGTLFDTLELVHADVDLGTVRRLAPAVELRGRVQLAGVLRGPWRAVTFDGQFAHRDGELPESRGALQALLDTRTDTVRFDAAFDAAPLAFDGIRPGYPAIPVQGAVEGPIEVRGTTGRFFTRLDVHGDLGRLALEGTIARAPGRVVAESLTARFTGLDLARLRGTGPATRLSGSLRADGALDSLAGPAGSLVLDLGPTRLGRFRLDTVHVRAQAADGVIGVDTLEAGWRAGRLAGGGRLAWRGEEAGSVTAQFAADSLAAFAPFLAGVTVPGEDSTAAADSLDGTVTGEVQLAGTAREPRLLLQARGTALGWRGVRVPSAAASVGWLGVARPELGGGIRADSVLVGRWRLEDLDLVLGGYQDSLRWGGQGRLAGLATVGAAGSFRAPPDSQVIVVDSLAADLPHHDWALTGPATVVLAGGRVALEGVTLAASDGTGALAVQGTVPRTAPGELTVSATGVDLRDIYALLERDTAGIAGAVQLDVAVGGTARNPTLQGTGSLADLAVGDLGSPFVQGIINYADRRLDANLLLWRTGQPVLRLEAELPLDLALQAVPRRQVEGPLRVRAIADSTDLGVLEAFTRNLRRVRGTLRADVAIEGSWNAPRLAGQLAIEDASAQVPGLGVRYTGVQAAAHLLGDSIVVDSFLARSGDGTLRVGGTIRLERLTRPVLGLTLRARRFRTIDVRRFLTLDASGTVELTGPVFGAHLTGRVTADAGNLHFADLITKRIVDLENPGDSGLIDLDLVRTERLGANFQSRFLDSLAIDTLQVQMGESFWLRSNEANIQLDGNLGVGKVRDRYRYDGSLNAVRGSYTLRIGGIVAREFTVERGTVRYFGTPDLNADLDIEARHTVIAAETSEEIPVVARITGTMLQPRLELSSPPTSSRPALSQTELVSYLMFSRPTFSLQGQAGQGSQYAAVETGLSYLSSALSSEIQRTLISDLGVPIDYIDIRAGGAGAAGLGGQAGAAQVAQLAAGWQIGRRWFVTLVADLCTNATRFYPNAEFRMTRQLRLKASVEPAYSCQVALNQPTLSVNKYQVGFDVLWDREY